MSQADRELDHILAEHFAEGRARRVSDPDDAAEFAREMQALLAEGEDAVFAGIDPAVRRTRAAAGPAGRPIAWRRVTLGVALAAGIACAVILGGPAQRPPDGDPQIDLFGAVAVQRGDISAPPPIPRFVSHSEVSIQSKVSHVPGGAPARELRVFLIGPD